MGSLAQPHSWVLPQSSSVSTWFLFSLFFPTFNEEFSLGPGETLRRGCQFMIGRTVSLFFLLLLLPGKLRDLCPAS